MERTLKISSQYRRNQYKRTVYPPKLVLLGNWLKNAGFMPGEFVKVIVADTYIQLFKIREGVKNGK